MDVFFNMYNQDDFLLISRKYFPDKEVLYPGKEFACNAGDPGLIPGMGRSSGEGSGYPLQYSWVSLVAQLVKSPLAMQETWFDPSVGKIPWRMERLPTPGDLPNPGIEPRSPALKVDSLPAEPPGKPKNTGVGSLSFLQGISS